ncbi:MAG TPA: protein kinase [Pyrinomonadaceae bacterium]|jgi:serine/threonine protein kinase
MIGQKISQYLILEKLGEGGMGVVYLAEDTVLGRRVAFKSLKNTGAPEYNQYKMRFLREARLASVLNHPNIVAVYDYGETIEGLPYLVMEYVKGKNLSDVLRENKLSVAECVEIIKPIARALSEAHDHGIVHRDLKPSNIFINERREVKVLDFGLAKLLDADSYNSKSYSSATSEMFTETREGVFMGTPSYSSPEQLLGTFVDRRSDIFSLGAVFYECLAGQQAFAGKNFAEICAQVIKDDPLPPSKVNLSISPEYDSVALKALSKKAENRYQTIRELIRDLETVPVESPTQKFTVNQEEPAKIPARSKSFFQPAIAATANFLRQNRFLTGAFIILAIAFLLLATNGRLRKFLTPRPAAEIPASYAEGVAALRNGNYYKAKKLLETTIQQNERFPLAHARLAEALSELGYEDKSTKEILRVTEIAPTFSDLSEIDQINLQAVAAIASRNYAGAIENYRQIIEKTPENDKRTAYFDLARAFETADQTDSAIENYAEAARRDPQFAAAYLRLGMLYGRKQETTRASENFQQAENLYNAASDYDGVAEVAYQRGYLLNIQDKLAEAEEKMTRANEIATVTKNASLQVKSLLHLSSIAYSLNDHASAQKYADQAIELARAEQLDNLATVGLIDVGNIFFTRGELAEAENKFMQAIERARTNEWQRTEARAALSLGSLYLQQTKAAEAIRFIEPALEFYERNNFRKETLQARLALGFANDQSGNYDAAIKAFSEQLRAAKELDDKTSIIQANEGIGLVLIHQEKFSAALVYYDENLNIFKSFRLDQKLGYNLLNRGQALWQLGRYKESHEAIEAATAIAAKPENGDKYLLAWTHLIKAQSDLSENNYNSAITESQKAIDLSGTQSGEIFVQAAFTEGLAKTRSGAKNVGIELCRKAVEEAAKTRMAHLPLKAKLALAETLLANGEAREALKIFLEMQKNFVDSVNIPTQWRSFVLASQASSALKDASKSQEYAVRAANLLAELEKNYGSENYKTYLSRPDVQTYQK